MASNGATETFAPQAVLDAMVTMRGSNADKKKAAMDYLDRFQKSNDAWTITINILQAPAESDVQLFAATTLKGKITYDLATQIPETALPELRAQILVLMKHFAAGPKPVRVQLCVCLAILAIQMRSWKDVLSSVVSALGTDVASHACLLDFLRVLPEEVTEGRKINLSEEELTERTTELLGNNSDQVVQLLINYAQSSPAAATNPLLFDCITSWLREVPVKTIVNSPLLDVILNGVTNNQSLAAASECLGTICRETSEVDDNLDLIQILLPKVISLQPGIQKVVEDEDIDSYKALTLMFADAGSAWVVMIAREPQHFRPLVEVILECVARDKDKDVVENTFGFWYNLKQYITLDRYVEARLEFVDLFSKLVDIFIKHLEYPLAEDGNELDLFDGDREQEEKFREFRHHMGDTLKDACEVMGTSECLRKVLESIKQWTQKYGSLATETSVPHWQSLEAPLFAMRAMGRMVRPEENDVLPQIIPLLVQIPKQEKLRFAAIMVIGRYTEWTAAHAEFLEPQFSYIVSSFETDSNEIIRAAAQSLKYLCTDCKNLLSGQVIQLQTFYNQILDRLPEGSQEELSEGVACVIASQKPEDIYRLLKLYCDPVMQRLMVKANNATDDKGKLILADHLQVIATFIHYVSLPYQQGPGENPAVKYWQEVFPILATVLDNFMDFVPICERICRCFRFMVMIHRTSITPLLPALANKLADSFARSRQGCFLWVTGAILREFSEDREHVDENITESIYTFFEQQATNVLRAMSDLPPQDLPDVVEDFYRLLIDALLFYPHKLVPSPLFTPILQSAISALSLEKREPLSAALHYIRDVLAVGPGYYQGPHSDALREMVKGILLQQGEPLVKQTLAGMMLTFPRDCFPDGSGVLLGMFQILPAQTTEWVDRTIRMLPAGTITPTEATRLMNKIREKLQTTDEAELRQIRSLLQDFTNTYRRRYVAPRDGLGQLEAKRFHFEG